MQYPALLAYYRGPQDDQPATVDIYHTANGAANLHLRDHLLDLEVTDDHYYLPDLSDVDESPRDPLHVNSDVPLSDLGNIIDYYDVDGLYLLTPDDLYTYLTVPMWPDINPIWLHGFNAAVYPDNESPVADNGTLNHDATPRLRFDLATFNEPLDISGEPFDIVAATHRDLFKSAKDRLADPDYDHAASDPLYVYTPYQETETVLAAVTDPDPFYELNTDGILIRCDTSDAADPTDVARRILTETNRLRTQHAQTVWESHLDAATKPQNAAYTDAPMAGAGQEDRPQPAQAAINNAYAMLTTCLERYGAAVSPLSARPYRQDIVGHSAADPNDFVASEPITTE